MKQVICAILSVFSLSSFSAISLDIDFKHKELNETIKLKKNVEAYLDQTLDLKLEKTNKTIRIAVTDRIPNVLNEGQQNDGLVMIDLKILEASGNEDKVITSSKIITTLGKEATLETFEGEELKKPTTSLKVTPRKL